MMIRMFVHRLEKVKIEMKGNVFEGYQVEMMVNGVMCTDAIPLRKGARKEALMEELLRRVLLGELRRQGRIVEMVEMLDREYPVSYSEMLQGESHDRDNGIGEAVHNPEAGDAGGGVGVGDDGVDGAGGAGVGGVRGVPPGTSRWAGGTIRGGD